MMKKINYILAFFILACLVFQGCKKTSTDFKDPYADGRPSLGVLLTPTTPPSPAIGAPGTEVTFQAKGFMKYKDKMVFYFNGEEAEVKNVTETTIVAIVPANGSGGVVSIGIDDQLVIGPVFAVTGNIKFDPSFRATAGTDNSVNSVYSLPDGRNLVLGNFTNYDNKGFILPVNRIARVSENGEYDATFRSGKGASGVLSRAVQIGNRIYIAGGFGGYDQRGSDISNITALFTNGSIDTIQIKTKKKPTLTDTVTRKWFPKFNGGTNEYINRVYNHQGKILATGDFRFYVKRTYDKDNYNFTRDTVILDSTEIRQILKFNLDGSLDKTYRFNVATGKGNAGANGHIDSYMHTEGPLLEKLLIFGNFTTFDGQPAGKILRLKVDGTLDPTFTPGSGANEYIASLTYNIATKKYFITGGFNSYNGTPVPGMALLNEDGTIDKSFIAQRFDTGFATYAQQLSNGLIVVTGSFRKYGGVSRNGFMVLTAKGDLAKGYNATGPFNGYVSDIKETKSADGKMALLLMGRFNRFDLKDVNNIIRVTVE
ncbi:hypothetical protein ABIB40_000887 [Pedobacter sp. UYP30]|uniref:DUF5008 domain-containing protein n=1 Tax=Pedobacter sp. UYP30 TaxID=1756400 RepID=UPI003393E0F7